jgi:hypothetical protein
LSQYVGVGAPVRIVKQARYKLFQASDGKWYLGYSDYNASTSDFDPLSPVSGPYDAYSTSSSGTGIGFRYYDVDGNEIASGANATNRAKIARVDFIARARTSDRQGPAERREPAVQRLARRVGHARNRN